MKAPQLLVHDKKDTVGVVVVEDLKAGTDMFGVVTADNSSFRLKAQMAVPIEVVGVALEERRDVDGGQDDGQLRARAQGVSWLRAAVCARSRSMIDGRVTRGAKPSVRSAASIPPLVVDSRS